MNAESDPTDTRAPRQVLSVSELNRAVASLLERNVPPLWVRGELSNVTRAASGHWYLTLKDDQAQVRAVMFRHRALGLGFVPRNGDEVEVRALASMYEPRGEFQLNVEAMRRAGEGGLYQRFVQLREKLRAEGLLDEANRRPLPALPGRVGVITSPRAAALRDVLATLARRAPHVPVVLYPTPVQGADAPPAIREALRAAIRRGECDVLLLVRGGGSIEDLWAFNDEALARDIAASPIPVVCGVGHESDFTIADFVADHRAATPTAAAQAAVPDRAALASEASALAARASAALRRALDAGEQRLDTAARLLRPPSEQWRMRGTALAAAAWRLRAAASASMERRAARVDRLAARVRSPEVVGRAARLGELALRLGRGARVFGAGSGERLDALAHKLELVSPHAVLERGYAIVRREGGQVVRSATAVAEAERLQVLLASGGLEVDVVARRGDDTL